MLTYMSSSNEVSEVAGPVRDPLEQLTAAIAAVGSVDLGAFSSHDRAEFLSSVERAGHRFAAVQTGQVDEIDRDSLHAGDGHWSAAVMIRHIGLLSGPEARARHRVAQSVAGAARVGHGVRCGRRRRRPGAAHRTGTGQPPGP